MFYRFTWLHLLSLALSLGCLAAGQVKPKPSSNNSAKLNFAPLTEPGGNAAMGILPTAFHSVGSKYDQGGFTFTASENTWGPQTLGAWKSGSPNHPRGGKMSTSLTAYYAGTKITMTSASGPFDLTSIDLSQWGISQGGGRGTFPMTFHGVRNGREVITQTFKIRRVPGSPVLATYRFKGFTNLDSVYVIEEGTFATGYGFQLNNIVLRARQGGAKGSSGGQSFVACHPGSYEEALLGNKPCAGPPGTSILIQAKTDFREREPLSGVVFKQGQWGAGATSSRQLPPSNVQVIVCRSSASNCSPVPDSAANNGVALVSGDGVQQGSLYQLAAPPELCSLGGNDKLWDVYMLFPTQPLRDIGYFAISCGP